MRIFSLSVQYKRSHRNNFLSLLEKFAKRKFKMKTVLVLSILCAVACAAPTAVVVSSPVLAHSFASPLLAQVAGEAPASTVHAAHIVAAPQVLSYSVPAVISPPEVIQANLGPHQVLAHHAWPAAVAAPHHVVSAYSLPASVVSLKFHAIKQVNYDYFFHQLSHGVVY